MSKTEIVTARKLLIIEDDPEAVRILSPYLEKEGFDLTVASNGKDGLNLAESWKPDLLILDLNLPQMSGFDVLKQLSNKPYLPVIVVTGRLDDTDKVVGLEIGADDYVTKPFNPRELVARVKAVFRRVEASRLAPQQEKLTLGEVMLDLKGQKLTVGNNTFPLTATELSLLKYLMQNSGHVLSREQILDHVWGEEFAGEPRLVDTYVKTLRRKLSSSLQAKQYIQSVRGVGYRFEA